MPSKINAQHPDVAMNAGHVDVTLQRCRQHVRSCMQEKGFDAREIPAGTFSVLWSHFRERPATGGEST
jgi:hypothetical protein